MGNQPEVTVPSIKQVIAEIQLDEALPIQHRDKVVRIIREAEQRVLLRRPDRPRGITGARGLMTLIEWELKVGSKLSTSMMAEWVVAHKLDPIMITKMIEEFRGDMLAKGKMYANFERAFHTYLRKGYLTQKFMNCTLEHSPFTSRTVVNNKGVDL